MLEDICYIFRTVPAPASLVIAGDASAIDALMLMSKYLVFVLHLLLILHLSIWKGSIQMLTQRRGQNPRQVIKFDFSIGI